MLPEIENRIKPIEQHLIDTADNLNEIERELMIQQQLYELNTNNVPYSDSDNIDDAIDKLQTFIENNKNKFFKISVYIFVMYYLLMCQPQQPQPQRGDIKRKTRKNKRKINK